MAACLARTIGGKSSSTLRFTGLKQLRQSTLTKIAQRHARASCFDTIDGAFDPMLPEFSSSYEHNKKLTVDLEKRLAAAEQGGGARGIDRHTKQNKKVFIRDRLKQILDKGYPFLEIAPLAGFDLEYGDVSTAGCVAVIGKIQGTLSMVCGNDATVKGGTVYPIGVKKQLRVQQISEENRLPMLHLTDSGGAYLPLQSEVFPSGDHGGRVFYNEAVSSANSIPQICLVAGSCTAGGAYVPTMADEAVIVDQVGYVFLGGPPLVFAATGEVVSQEDLGGATMHCSVSGALDHFAKTEQEAFRKVRQIFETLNLKEVCEFQDEFEEPLYSAKDLMYLAPCSNQEGDRYWDIHKILARVVDGSRFQEFKAIYGRDIVTGFARIEGIMVGIIGNCKSKLSADGCTKATHFVQLCSQRKIPLVFLQSDLDNCYAHNQAILKLKGSLMSAIATSQVPKITLLLGNINGSDYHVLCGRGLGPRYIFALQGSSLQLGSSPAEVDEFASNFPSADISEIEVQMKSEASVFYGASRLWSDSVISPEQTRNVLSLALKSTLCYNPIPDYQQSFLRL